MGAEEYVRSQLCYATDTAIDRSVKIAHRARRRMHDGMPEAYFVRQVTIGNGETNFNEISTFYVDTAKLQRVKDELHTFTSMLSLCRESIRNEKHDFRSNVLKGQKLFTAFIDARIPILDEIILIAITGVSEDDNFARGVVDDAVTALGFSFQYSKW